MCITAYSLKTDESCIYEWENRYNIKCIYETTMQASWICKRDYEYVTGRCCHYGLCVVELKATEDGYSLYKSIGFADSVSRYHQMEWRNESAEKNTL